MDRRGRLLSTLSILALGAGATVSQTSDAAAQTYSTASIQQCVASTGAGEAECACTLALEDGSPEALAKFLEQYASAAGDTACAALASTALVVNDRGGRTGPY